MKKILFAILMLGAFNSFACGPTSLCKNEIVALIQSPFKYWAQGLYTIGLYKETLGQGTTHESYEVAPLSHFNEKTGEWGGYEINKDGSYRYAVFSYEKKYFSVGRIVKEYAGFKRGGIVTVDIPNERQYRADISEVFSNGVVVLSFTDLFKRRRVHVTTLRDLGLVLNYED